ncbi:hypothetical protein [Streptomyces mirabilis]|uniref:hypothetical protein n=1 Tax=Streptomyces mirabilis TaxID=68239 RepID=UPI0036B7134D
MLVSWGKDATPFQADWAASPYACLALEREERLTGDEHVVRSTKLVVRQSVRSLS